MSRLAAHMVKINPPITPPSPTPRPQHRATRVEAIAPVNKDKPELPPSKPFVERRKSRTDRRARKDARGPFDMRSGRDRRKNSGPYPSIEEDV